MARAKASSRKGKRRRQSSSDAAGGTEPPPKQAKSGDAPGPEPTTAPAVAVVKEELVEEEGHATVRDTTETKVKVEADADGAEPSPSVVKTQVEADAETKTKEAEKTGVKREIKAEGKTQAETKTELALAGDQGWSSDDDDGAVVQKNMSRCCPYLDTIKREMLDFDFEKLCSISLSNQNTYCCLVCGKYFQGRGRGTHAYNHAVSKEHHVFINLSTKRVYCLPDNYEVIDNSLSDIIYVLDPRYTTLSIQAIVNNKHKKRLCLDHTSYIPSIVGLNNIKANDYVNVIMQALSRIEQLRDYCLLDETSKRGRKAGFVETRFAELVRKLWNPRNFKSHVSPHELGQAVVKASKKRFKLTEQSDPLAFLQWFLATLHKEMGGTQKVRSSLIHEMFQGTMRVYTRKLPPPGVEANGKEYEEVVKVTPFTLLTLDVPPAPLFQDQIEKNIIPQVPMNTLLQKFDGKTEIEVKTYEGNYMKRYEVLTLPKYLVVHIKRFTKNNFFREKNLTIVNFPVRNLDLSPIIAGSEPGSHKYNLVSNIVHDGQVKEGTYRVNIEHKGMNQWYDIQDLHIANIPPDMIALSEAYIQFYERAS